MNKKIFIIHICIMVAFFSIFIAVSALAAVTKTIDNLNFAYKGETNANHTYELLAKKADEDGYKQIAKLFRAVSMAESIHRNNHKAVILGLGGTPDIIDYDVVQVKSTKENLQLSIKDETHEKDVMYPEFIKQAQIDKLPDAVQTFSFAGNAEAQHEKLYEDALKNLGNNKPVDYCVSRVSGATYAITPNSKCPCGKFGLEQEYIRIK